MENLVFIYFQLHDTLNKNYVYILYYINVFLTHFVFTYFQLHDTLNKNDVYRLYWINVFLTQTDKNNYRKQIAVFTLKYL